MRELNEKTDMKHLAQNEPLSSGERDTQRCKERERILKCLKGNDYLYKGLYFIASPEPSASNRVWLMANAP